MNHRRAAACLVGVLLLAPGIARPAGGAAAEERSAKSAQRTAKAKKPPATKSTASASTASGQCVHVVRSGESVARIAQRYHVTRQAIVTANHLSNPNALRAGQRLEVPGCKSQLARSGAAVDAVKIVEGSQGQELVARVGPRRIPTRLALSVPGFSREEVAFRWPIEGPVVSGFGRRRAGWHAGVDIKADMGSPIRAAADGVVVFSGAEKYYGRMIKLEHIGSFTTLYAHNLENLVQMGAEVKAGAVIATVGRSGHASDYHLHFEIRRLGVAYNPLQLLEEPEAPVLTSAPAPPVEEETSPLSTPVEEEMSTPLPVVPDEDGHE